MPSADLPSDPYEHSHHLEITAQANRAQFYDHPELQNSMLYWYPRLRDAVATFPDIQTPATLFVDLERINVHQIVAERDEPMSDAEIESLTACPARWDDAAVRRAADALGYPAFIRTDTDSAKHDFEAAAKLDAGVPNDVHDTVEALIRATARKGGLGPRFNCLAVREWIDIAAEFTAFGGTPIGPEVRVFVRDGTVECHHFYWPLDDADTHDVTGVTDLDAALADLEATTDDAMDALLREAAAHIGDQFDGYWSVDFAQATDGTWYVIDMAHGDDSWHPTTCDHVAAEPPSSSLDFDIDT